MISGAALIYNAGESAETPNLPDVTAVGASILPTVAAGVQGVLKIGMNLYSFCLMVKIY